MKGGGKVFYFHLVYFYFFSLLFPPFSIRKRRRSSDEKNEELIREVLSCLTKSRKYLRRQRTGGELQGLVYYTFNKCTIEVS